MEELYPATRNCHSLRSLHGVGGDGIDGQPASGWTIWLEVMTMEEALPWRCS